MPQILPSLLSFFNLTNKNYFTPPPTTLINSLRPKSIMISMTKNSSPSSILFVICALGSFHPPILSLSSLITRILNTSCPPEYLTAVKLAGLFFLSEYDFKLDYAPGKNNPADAPSRCPDYIPQEGDEVVQFQHKALLTDSDLEHLFPCNPSPSLPKNSTNISTLSTFTIDNSKLLDQFKTAFRLDKIGRAHV